MKILVTGSHGLIGSKVVSRLRERGDEVITARRGTGTDTGGTVAWDSENGKFDATKLVGLSAVVHLGGAGIGDRRWNGAVKDSIYSSRIDGTRQVVSMLESLRARGVRLLCASAIGIYGDRGDEVLSESSPPGTGFLARVATAWETEAMRAQEFGISVATLRTGIVQSRSGGALAKQLPLFRAGLGAKLGGGSQWMSWIHIDDEVEAIIFLLDHPLVEGPVNLVAPQAQTNQQYSSALAKCLGRPMLFSAPKLVLKAALGPEMAEELLLVSQRVSPQVLLLAGYKFHFESLELALADLLKR